jgi:hypothetical protein
VRVEVFSDGAWLKEDRTPEVIAPDAASFREAINRQLVASKYLG